MNRREFLMLSAAGLLDLGLAGPLSKAEAKERKGSDKEYSVVILGDTHFDTEPASVYHSNYNEPVEWLNKVQREEFARNGEMWRERCPRLMKRAAELVDEDTRMIFQMGDLIQGDCGKGEVHRQMLEDVMESFKAQLGGLHFVTVVGNHDVRGTDAKTTYHEFMPTYLSGQLGKTIHKTTFSFNIGDDAYIFADFNDPDNDEMERLLVDADGARHTFVVVHGPVFPCDGGTPTWFYQGKDTEARRHFRAEFAKRKVMALCGHTHRTEYYDWRGDGGRIVQMTMNSVWSKPEYDKYELISKTPEDYGKHCSKEDAKPLFEEYREGLAAHTSSRAAGSYLLRVGRRHVFVDFYAGDSETLTQSFQLK